MTKSGRQILDKNLIHIGRSNYTVMLGHSDQFAMSNMMSLYLEFQDCRDLGVAPFLQSDQNVAANDYMIENLKKRKKIMFEMGCDTWEKCNKKMNTPFHDEFNLLVLKNPPEKFLKQLEEILPLIKDYNIYYIIDCCNNMKLYDRLAYL